ncbi:MAG: 3-hydroxyacyl-CoA dehydrogenase/enoyl-CoA hydratase family protein [Planctomycetota bacterium]|nr:MAG: 3-hydroxyacyl-CoA dehydrogenase/enoyl-CoA hydratase family protein [Planctomycetota bacterium]
MNAVNRVDIRTAAVIGAGNMGSGIAQKIATEGYPVILVDMDEPLVQRGLGIIRATLEQGVERGIFRKEAVEGILGRVRGTADWSALAEADLVVEAVFEDLQVKRDVFRKLGKHCRPDAILATNTSSFFVRDLAQVTPRPERVFGLHYFYHPAKNRLVEVIRHEGSGKAEFDAAWSFQEAIGKTPIRSADAPGFVVNRFFVPWLNEAVRVLEEGSADIPTIEAAARKAFEIGMGPFELMNVTGVAIAMHAADTLGRELHPYYAPAARLRQQVDARKLWDLGGTPDPSRLPAVADRLLGAAFYCAAKLVEEKVASVEETDIGARVGLRWAMGPFQLINEVGVRRAAVLANAVVAGHGLTVPLLLQHADPRVGIPIHLVALGQRGRLTSVWIQRPDAMNALNEDVVQQLENAAGIALAMAEHGIVIGGSGKAFVAGADIRFFVENLRGGTFQRIHDFTARGQKLFRTLSGGRRPVVARVQGLALGGGAELALACDWIAASPKAAFGFPETGIGIYPGLGGTQRLPRRVGLPLAKYLVYTGQILGADQALAIGLCDQLATFSLLDAACEALAERGPAVPRSAPRAPRDPSWKPVWDFFDRYSVDQILSGQGDTGGNAQLERAVKRMREKSSLALRLSERLFDEGCDLPLEEGLDLELAHLQEIFSSPDALEGLSSLIEGRKPAFAGR